MRRRIVVLVVVAAALAIALFGVPLAYAAARYYLADERVELERLADDTALRVVDDLFAGRAPDSVPTGESGSDVAVYSPAGTRVVGTGPDALDPAGPRIEVGEVVEADTAAEFVVVIAIARGDEVVGIIRAASPTIEYYQRTGLTWAAMVLLGGVALAGTWLVARGQARRLAEPLERLAGTAARLGDADFTARARDSGIPEVDSVGSALTLTAQRLDALLERERAFTADASHQLRTPLAGLRLQLESALENPDADPRRAIADGIDTTDVLERTIDDLLALARDVPSAASTGQVGEILDGLAGQWRRVLAERGLAVEVTGEAAAALVAGPVLRQVVAVLLDNAVGHGAGEVRLAARVLGDTVAVDVTDQGVGPAAGTDVFRRRAHDSGGHGIGLALARRLAEAEGGRLRLLRTDPTQFTLVLPTR
ncbi:sensor histidine kinase [Actinokineospora cianjurensis]|uniref:histidine kinase n=1 Tax=Actinokineospora cianjurensis TaxID=585224 RepID=A0A421BC93_9PSEU|nr:HAMP domain-containing sensor histidine kinase [Actinokineospora cianjurensis]RLK61995.1 signal transduction histidine kinase [Actinokineospora cianjurensis]